MKAEHGFDYAVVNDDLQRCVAAVIEIVRAERLGDTAGVLARYGRAVTLARLRDEFEF